MFHHPIIASEVVIGSESPTSVFQGFESRIGLIESGSDFALPSATALVSASESVSAFASAFDPVPLPAAGAVVWSDTIVFHHSNQQTTGRSLCWARIEFELVRRILLRVFRNAGQSQTHLIRKESQKSKRDRSASG